MCQQGRHGVVLRRRAWLQASTSHGDPSRAGGRAAVRRPRQQGCQLPPDAGAAARQQGRLRRQGALGGVHPEEAGEGAGPAADHPR